VRGMAKKDNKSMTGGKDVSRVTGFCLNSVGYIYTLTLSTGWHQQQRLQVENH